MFCGLQSTFTSVFSLGSGPGVSCYYPCFTDEEATVLECWAVCSRSHRGGESIAAPSFLNCPPSHWDETIGWFLGSEIWVKLTHQFSLVSVDLLGRGFSDPPVFSSLERACQIETKMADLRCARPSLLLHQAIVATVGMGVSTIILFFCIALNIRITLPVIMS